MSLSEFDIIDQFFRQQRVTDPNVIQGIGDDAAIIDVPAGQELIISTDTLVEHIHFPETIGAEDLGYRALAVNLSDLAAMGAEPRWITLALTLPRADEDWLRGFSAGFLSLADEYRLALVGGDITRGPLTITVQVHGTAQRGTALRRSGARPGDLVYVTGTLGGAGIALACMHRKLELEPEFRQQAYSRYSRPSPRIRAGITLRGLATGAIDVSDGLLADLGHILEASGVGARVEVAKLPLFETGNSVATEDLIRHALTSGDDYELCFTASPDLDETIKERLSELVPVCCIGKISEETGLRCMDREGQEYHPATAGYQHFAQD